MKQLSSNKNYLIDIYETHRLDSAKLNQVSVSSYSLWLRQLNCTLDGYAWLLSRKFVNVTTLLNSESSVIWSALKFYLNNSPATLFGDSLVAGSLAGSKISALYSNVSHRLVSFLTFSVESDEHEETITTLEREGILADEGLIEIVVRMLLLPTTYVEETRSEDGTAATSLSGSWIAQLVSRFLAAMHKYAPPRFLRHFSKAAGNILVSSDKSLLGFTLVQGIFREIRYNGAK